MEISKEKIIELFSEVNHLHRLVCEELLSLMTDPPIVDDIDGYVSMRLQTSNGNTTVIKDTMDLLVERYQEKIQKRKKDNNKEESK